MDQSVEVAKEVAEIALDGAIDEGLLREIPVFSWLVSTCRIVSSVRERLFLKKIAIFLNDIGNVSEDTKQAFVQDLDANPGEKKELGEKLILLLDRMNNFDKARLLSIVFRSYVCGSLDEVEFTYLCDAVDTINSNLLENFPYMPPNLLDNANGFALVNVGLADVQFAIEDINDGFRHEYDPVGYAKPLFKKSTLGEKFSELLRTDQQSQVKDGELASGPSTSASTGN